MAQRERESLAQSSGDLDPHTLLFGPDDDHAHTGEFEPIRLTRADRRRTEHARSKRRSRRGWVFVALTVALVVAVAIGAWKVVDRLGWFSGPADYSGSGTGSVSITIPSGASASDIGDILQKADVVKSTEAFTDAAGDNSKSESIQPGVYNVHLHMSGKAALTALLDPSSRNHASDLVVPEGTTSLQVKDKLVSSCSGATPDAVDTAMQSPADLGVPTSYKVNGRFPKSIEGFLYPATYRPDPPCTATDALRDMVVRFQSQDRDMHFADAAQKDGITPYEALTIASIVQAEAKYSEDMPKVAEVVYNRLAADEELKIDATTKYACEQAQVAHCIYNNYPSRYNTYLNKNLPPTPIGNPGAEAMDAAVHPAKGKLVFYVNGDKDGHLAFSTNEKDFEKDRVKCVQNNWGCG